MGGEGRGGGGGGMEGGDHIGEILLQVHRNVPRGGGAITVGNLQALAHRESVKQPVGSCLQLPESSI